jgi:4-amino-4-deoxy-L-arabinose transferase-like glycosyltransferase
MRNSIFIALALVSLTVATRLPSLLHPQPIDDEAVYSVVANEIVDGGRPYIDAVERKPPLLFWTYAAIFKAAGKFDWKALHAVALVWTLATMAGLYVIGRELFDRETGLTAALFYSVFQPWLTSKDLAFNGELLMNLPVVWAWAIAFGCGWERLRLELLVAGALLCAGFLLKQPAAIAAPPLAIYLLLPDYRRSRGLSFKASAAQAMILAAGFFGALGLVTLVLWKQGILREAFYWTITNHDIPYVFWGRGVILTLAFVAACLPLLIGAWMAFRDADGVWANRIAERKALLLLVAASALGAAAGGRFYDHYYIQLIPPLALLAAPHYARLLSGKTEQSFRWLKRPVTYAWLALTVAAFSLEHWRELASQRELSETGRYLADYSAPDDKVFVWGQAPKIYLDARRRPACRYIATFPLTGYIFGPFTGTDTRDRIIPGAWTTLQEDFRKHPPVYIVDVQAGAHNAQYPVKNFPILARLLTEQYQPVRRTAEGVVYHVREGQTRAEPFSSDRE